MDFLEAHVVDVTGSTHYKQRTHSGMNLGAPRAPKPKRMLNPTTSNAQGMDFIMDSR